MSMLAARFIASRPEDVGVDSERLEAVFARRSGMDEGVLPSAQVAVARNGKIAGMRTFGRGDGRIAALHFLVHKAVVASAMWLLFEEGLLKLDERVGDIVPEFRTNGKDVITVGARCCTWAGSRTPFRTADWDSREKLLEAFSRWRLNWEPGTKYEYHATSGHWVLSEIIYRRAGRGLPRCDPGADHGARWGWTSCSWGCRKSTTRGSRRSVLSGDHGAAGRPGRGDAGRDHELQRADGPPRGDSGGA